MILNSPQNQEEFQANAQIIRMNDEELQKSLQQKAQIEKQWASDQIKIKNLTKELNKWIASNETIQKQCEILQQEKHEQQIQADNRLQEQAQYYDNKHLQLQEEKNQLEVTIKSNQIEFDQKNKHIQDKDIIYSQLNYEYEKLNNNYQNLLNECETLKNQLIERDIKIQKLVEFQKSMNSSLNFLSKKDESNNKIIGNFKEKEKFFVNKIDQQRKKETEFIIKISQLMYQIKQLEDQLLQQQQALKNEKRHISQQEVKIRELNDEIVRLKLMFQKQSIIGHQDKSEQHLEIQIKYTHIEQFEQKNEVPLKTSRQSLEQEEKHNSILVSKLDKQIIELEERIVLQEAYIQKLKKQSQIQVNKNEQEQYSKFNPFKIFFLSAAKCKIDVAKVQVKQ